MNSERWQRVAHLYESVLEREPDERNAFLAESCAGDDALLREVQSLLAQDGTPVLIDRPMLETASAVLAERPDLDPGTQLGPYRVDVLVGAGGMGQVYRAIDTRLNRTVAIKVLPKALAADPQFRARFDREAQAIAALTHPHVCTLHDVGSQDGVDFLVMEYVDGETLAARLDKGPLPLEQALKRSVEIADALATAHRHGIIHRDLKPGNIILTRGGAKLLDFGLAKPSTPIVTSGSTASAPDVTGQGTILGTFQYMAPEQLEGKDADARTDIFAFGAVLYEMLTGKKAFEGNSQASLIGAIMHAEPAALATAQPLTPPALDRIVKACLAKDPNDRWQTARDLLRELEWVRHARDDVAPVAPRAVVRRAVPLVAAVALTAVAAGYAAWTLGPTPAPPPLRRFTIPLPSGDQFFASGHHLVAISPDGSRLVYSANRQLYLRAIDRLDATPLTGTGDADRANAGRGPFFSPDGQWVGFWQGGQLKKVSVTGGAPVPLCDAQNPWGATWGEDDTILYGQGGRGIWRVPGSGGQPERIVGVDVGQSARWPELLPGGRTVLFALAHGDEWDETQIVTQSLDTGARTVIVTGGTDAHYMPTGHLVYAVRESVLAVPFDTKTLMVTGGPVPVVNDVFQSNRNVTPAQIAVARDGTLLYVPGSALPPLPTEGQRTLVWVDRLGREEPLGVPPRTYRYARLSPDGTRVALEVENQDRSGADIWILDLRRGQPMLLPSTESYNRGPVWSGDDDIIFNSSPFGGSSGNLARRAADGTGPVERLTVAPMGHFPSGISPDGSHLILSDHVPPGNPRRPRAAFASRDIMMLPLDPVGSLQPIQQTEADERYGVVSPDGHWLAYDSNVSGPVEVYVRPFPDAGGASQLVSTAGGSRPLWARSGRELFYLSPSGAMMSVSVEPGTIWKAGPPKVVFQSRYYDPGVLTGGTFYDVSLDGRRFLMIKDVEREEPPPPASAAIVVVQNWFEELRRRVPSR